MKMFTTLNSVVHVIVAAAVVKLIAAVVTLKC